MEVSKKEETFFNIIAIIGAVLIFVGVAWLIAENWHQIPDIGKVAILVFSTLASFVLGTVLRDHKSEASGRAMITLGSLLYILSIFLIAQIYSTSTSTQGTAWLLFLCWPIIIAIAYLLDSPESLLISLGTFFIWVTTQYFASVENIPGFREETMIMAFVLIFLSAGSLLYGLTVFHKAISHRFTSIYRFWTVLYFLGIFYVLSFQGLLPALSEYSFTGGAMSIFLISFILVCFLGFVITALFAVSDKSISFKEIAGFVGVIALVFALILMTKVGAGLVGYCNPINCYDFDTSSECASAPSSLTCMWDDQNNYCEETRCYNFRTESDCVSALGKLECIWEEYGGEATVSIGAEGEAVPIKGFCESNTTVAIREFNDNSYQTCREFNNQKDQCESESDCNWNPSMNTSGNLPTSLWLLWILNNAAFLGFIILVLWLGQAAGSTKIVNLGLAAFILDVITRYIGFWIDLSGYFAFSVLAILGGIILISGAWFIPRWRRKLLSETKHPAPSSSDVPAYAPVDQ